MLVFFYILDIIWQITEMAQVSIQYKYSTFPSLLSTYSIYVWWYFFRTPPDKRLECLHTVFPQFIVLNPTELYDQWHNSFQVVTDAVTSCAATKINTFQHDRCNRGSDWLIRWNTDLHNERNNPFHVVAYTVTCSPCTKIKRFGTMLSKWRPIWWPAAWLQKFSNFIIIFTNDNLTYFYPKLIIDCCNCF